jgi:hypothetical protein
MGQFSGHEENTQPNKEGTPGRGTENGQLQWVVEAIGQLKTSHEMLSKTVEHKLDVVHQQGEAKRELLEAKLSAMEEKLRSGSQNLEDKLKAGNQSLEDKLQSGNRSLENRIDQNHQLLLSKLESNALTPYKMIVGGLKWGIGIPATLWALFNVVSKLLH